MHKIFLFILFIFFNCLAAQSKPSDSISFIKNQNRNIDFKIMPYLNYSRTLEFMLGVIPMAMYKLDKNDTISPRSLSGISAVYTSNKSYFAAAFNRFYLKEDKWRVQLFMLNGNKNAEFYIDDIEIPDFYNYSTETTLVSAVIQHRIIENFYGGLGYTYTQYHTIYEDEVQPSSTIHTNGIQLNMMFDTRDAVYYPTKGDKIKLKWTSYPSWFANDSDTDKINAEYNKYFQTRNGSDVLAARFSGQFGLGNIPFEQQVTIGGKDIRGYSEGKYRGNGLISIQGEYRYNFNEKMGLVGFAGAATIYGSDTEYFNWRLYPGAGAGYRYRAFKTEKFNVGLDAAVGKGDWGIYFRIGEAF